MRVTTDVSILKQLIGTRDRTSTLSVAILTIYPLLLISINRSWVFDRVGWLDPWIYLGYHVHIGNLLHDFPGSYYEARVPWTVLGAIVHRIAGAELSLYILGLFLLYVSTFSLYYAVRVIFDSPIGALVSACILATNSWFLWAIGWTYVDGSAITLMLVSFAALTSAARERHWQGAATLFGAAAAATAAVYLLDVVFLPIQLGMFLVFNHFGKRRPVVAAGLYWIAGFAGAVIAMGVANWIAGGNFLFFTPTFVAARVVGGLGNPYYTSWNNWFWAAPWLLFPTFAFIASVFLGLTRGALILRRDGDEQISTELRCERDLLVVAVACILASGGFALIQASHFYSTLQVFYWANILLPFDFLVIGGCLASSLMRTTTRAAISYGIIAPILAIAPWLAGAFGWVHVPLASSSPTNPNWMLQPVPVLLSGRINEPLWMLAGGILLIGATLIRHWSLRFGVVVFVTVVSIATITDESPIRLPGDAGFKDRTLIALDIAAVVDTFRKGALTLWWDHDDRENKLFTSMSMMYPNYNPALFPGRRLVFLGSGGKPPETVLQQLRDKDLVLVPVAREHVQHGAIGIDFLIADVATAH